MMRWSYAGPLSEVEIMTRDAGVADLNTMAGAEGDDVYKPRVMTWGMFPWPADISKVVTLQENGQMCDCDNTIGRNIRLQYD